MCIVRTHRSLQLDRRVGVFLRRVGTFLRETVLLAAFVGLIEVTGSHAVHDGADLMALGGASILLALIARGGRAGWLPLTGALMERCREGLQAGIRRLAPGYAIAFRRDEEVPARADTVLLWPLAVVGTLALLVLAVGPWLQPGALFLKEHVSYVLYLTVMATVWALQGGILLIGLVAAGTWLRRRVLQQRGPAPSLALLLGWGIGSALLAYVPGIVPVGLLLGVAAWRWRGMGNPLAGRYLFCRRDDEGQAHVVPVQTLLLRAHAFAISLLALAVALAAGPRLWSARWPDVPFAFTDWLGLSSALAALLLAQQAGAHLRRIAGSPRQSPELPLTPTLWMKEHLPDHVAQPTWMRVARNNGWWVTAGPHAPDTGFDLVHGAPDHPRRFVPLDTEDEEDARFQLERRFHVVARRRFHKRFQHLVKQLRRQRDEPGSGFLFCPHVWLVPGVVRDAEPKRAGRSPFVMPSFYGTPYAQLFDVRLRRYLGSVLRTLEIDLVFWEDAVTWKDLRRVTGVLFEAYDQGRSPLRAREFVGLPGLRVLIQEEPAELEPADPIPDRPPAPGHARILLIMKDRGEDADTPIDVPTGSSRRTPILA